MDVAAQTAPLSEEGAMLKDQHEMGISHSSQDDASNTEDALDLAAFTRQLSEPDDVESFMGRLGSALGLTT